MFRKIISAALTYALALLPASAGINNPGSGAAPTQGQVNLVLGAAFNGGTGYEYPFLNYMKSFQPQGTANSPGLNDTNGYPVSASLPNSQQGTIFLPVAQTTAATTWVWKWTGLPAGTSAHPPFFLIATTTVTSDPGGCVVGGFGPSNLVLAGHSCRIEFNFTNNPSSLTFSFASSANFDGTLSGLTLVRKSDEAALDAGGIFNPDFISKVSALRPRSLRIVNWNNVNSNSNLSANLAEEIPVAALSYSGHWEPTIWAGSASGTNTYTGTLGGVSSLVEGTTIQINFPNASSVSPTFNLNGLGAVQMSDPGGTNLGTTAIGANSNWTLVYDALLNKWKSVNGSAGSGVPLSVMIALCNQVGSDLWYNIPINFTDAKVSAFATTIKATLNSNLKAWYELSDEVWNPIYTSTALANARGAALAFPTAMIGPFQQIWDYYSLRHRQVMGVVTTAYGVQTNYRRVLAGWAVFLPSVQNTLRLQGTDLNGATNATYCAYVGGSFSGGVCTNDPGYNTFPNRAVDFSDAISYAAYSAGAQAVDFDVNYTSVQTPKSVTAATNTNPVKLTIASHGYATGQRIWLGLNAAQSVGTNFTGGWSGLNSSTTKGQAVTVVDANNITVPLDASGFAAYSSNGGSAARFANELTGLLTAADQWAAGDFSDAITFLDNDIRAGTNYGVLSTNTIASYSSASGGGLGIYDQWETIAAGYDGAGRPSGLANLLVVNYEGSIDPIYPSAAACTTLGIDPKYGTATGTIANMLGVGKTASSNSYKMSPQFQATVKLLYDDFFSRSHSAYSSQYEIFSGDNWALGSGDLYDPLFSSYPAVQNYHFP